ncbi:jg15636 [Pararge aegeria aegeria]|uniref:Armadillo repeat-containing protein 8 n=1 Tax=Pararge aegeria aegeria TaxID=348720 RepID=A0A8S4S0L6_9NEOP|nr:jg15636 [Pararge aegeria aegeria]
MQQLTVFMDIESSRSYIDELYSTDPDKLMEALVTLKNSVIGSNRQKSSVIQQGIVPRLLQLMTDDNLDANIRLEATITIGEFAGSFSNILKSFPYTQQSVWHGEKTIPELLTVLVSRDKPLPVAMGAARCLTFIHRAGALASDDNRVVFGALPCLARLCTKEMPEDIRATAAETLAYLAEVRLAAVRCLHSLSRSVQQLRTTFQDHAVWRPLMQLLNESPGTELLTVGSSTLCNLLLEFSPAKEPMLDQGAVEMLCNLTKRPEAALRLNGIWALMNMAFQAEQKVKQRILCCLGTEQMFRLLGDGDTRVIMKTLGLLRNLLSTRNHIDAIMAEYSSQVMQAVIVVLEGSYPAEVKEQALCILGNIGDGEKAKDLIMANEDVLRKLVDYLAHPESKLQEAALFVAGNLVWRGEAGAAARQARLADLGVLRALKLLRARHDAHHLHEKVKTALAQFSDLT